jgi:ABC-2 type transport system ATP-binding protein
MIEVEDITREFGSIVALKDVSFRVEKGEVVGFLGPNGAGKTTMMRILTCFIPPTSGVAKIDGLDVTRHSLEVRRKIGYFLERVALYPDMRVFPFLRFSGEVKGVERARIKQVVSEAMEICGLEQVGNRIINNLSKGYRQRVGLAQALLNKPEVLILDEPTIGLDPEQVSEIRKVIKALSGERTVILSSHILSEVSMICSKVIIIDNGRVVAVDTPENLSDLLQERVTTHVQIEGASEMVLEELKKISGVSRVEAKEKISDKILGYRIESEKGTDICGELNILAFRNQWILREIQPVEMSLEEIFFKIVAKEGKS